MYLRRFENTTFTQWTPVIDKLKAAPAKGTSTAPKGPQARIPTRRGPDKYKWISIEVRYNGGPEASWLVRARGVTWRFPGHMCLHDVLDRMVG